MFLIIAGIISLQMVLVFAMSNATSLGIPLGTAFFSKRLFSLRLYCLLLQRQDKSPRLVDQLYWDLVIVLYYLSILDKIRWKKAISHSSSWIYRAIVKPPASFDDFQSHYSSRLTWMRSRCLESNTICKTLVTIETAYIGLNMSVFSDIPWLLLVLVFSVQATLAYWISAGLLVGSQTTLGFGQLTALILLIVPILNALDVAMAFCKYLSVAKANIE